MGALYLDAQGANLGVEGERLTVTHKGERRSFPVAQVDRVVLIGCVHPSARALAFLLDRGTPTIFLAASGRYRGRLSGPAHPDVRLRMRQYDTARDPARSLVYARQFVIGKIRNGKELVCRRLQSAGHNPGRLRERLKGAMRAAGGTCSLERLRGIEGGAARDYFAGFATLLRGTPFPWRGRRRQPPTDPVNAMLSLGYSLLLGETIGAIEATGLDVYAGFLHGGMEHAEHDKPALALDLMEEFRPRVDQLVLRLALGGRCSLSDFERRPDGGCHLKPEMRKRFFHAWEAAMTASLQYDHRKLPLRAIIGEQAARLARAVRDESANYRAFMP